MTATRREFLAAGAAAGLTIAFHLGDAEGSQTPGPSLEPNAHLRIEPDGTTTLWVSRFEMGQGVRTVLPMILADELEADWTTVRIEQANPGGKFKGIQMHTGGSGSVIARYTPLRVAAAAAREMLIGAAAARWNVAPGSCVAEKGVVVHQPTGRRAGYGSLVAAAARLPVPKEPALKEPAQFRLIGRPMKRVDGPAIVTGKAVYGLDVRLPGMLVATIERSPVFGATVASIDRDAALKVPGVRFLVPVTRGIHPGVAVVADDTWSALRGRAVLHVDWDTSSAVRFESERYLADLPAAFERATFKVRHEGDAPRALQTAARRHEAIYVFPFQAHASVETVGCTADVRPDSADVWVATQTDVRTLQQAAKVAGLPEDAVHVHALLVGGGFGRRLYADYVSEAVEISKAIARPVQVMWTREDDMRFGYYEPATAERFTAGLDEDGRIVALMHATTGSDHTAGDIHQGRNIWKAGPKPPKAPDAYASDESPWGAFDNPYEFQNLKVDCADITSPVPVGPWRAVEYPSTVFARESFLDELAHLVSKDPIALRLELLPPDVKTVGEQKIDRKRLARVLEAARERSGWTRPVGQSEGRRRARGVAANVYHAGSYIAMVADVSVANDSSDLRVHRITTVIDCGIAVNPLGITGQTESGIAWGLSATLAGKMDFRNGAAVQRSFADFEVLRIGQMPELDTVILDSGARPGGFGEHPVPLVAPAVANAISAATGRRVRSLPITPAALGDAIPG